jgi:hypothetical protein
MSDEPVAVDQEEVEAFAIPSEFVNRFRVNVYPAITRIAFAEGSLPRVRPTYRLAVTMTTANAKLLVKLLSDLIASVEERAEAAATKASDTPPKPQSTQQD